MTRTIGTPQTIRTDNLNTYHHNPRRGDVNTIAESLRTNGQFRPIVVNTGTHTGRPMEVLAGNHTLLAARHLDGTPHEITELDCYVVDVDDDRARRIVLADNRTSDLGGYDDEALADLLETLGDDLEGTGYDEDDLADLMENLEEKGDPDWGDAMNTLPGDEPSSYTRTFTLTREQSEIVDSAIATAKEHTAGDDGNVNGNALAWLCWKAEK